MELSGPMSQGAIRGGCRPFTDAESVLFVAPEAIDAALTPDPPLASDRIDGPDPWVTIDDR